MLTRNTTRFVTLTRNACRHLTRHEYKCVSFTRPHVLPTGTFLSIDRYCHSTPTTNNNKKTFKIEFDVPTLPEKYIFAFTTIKNFTIEKIIGYSSDVKLTKSFFSSPLIPDELIPVIVPRVIAVLLMGLTYVVYKDSKQWKYGEIVVSAYEAMGYGMGIGIFSPAIIVVSSISLPIYAMCYIKNKLTNY